MNSKPGGAFGLSILSGLLAALTFPKINLFFFAWVFLIPLFFALLGQRPRRAFGLGFAAGFIFYSILLYWIPSVPAHYGNLSPALSFLVYLVLVALMSLFWAFFALLHAKIGQIFPRFCFLLAPFIWVAMEYAATYVLTGFPWGLIGYSQVKNLPFLQLAATTGVYGISFVLVFLQGCFLLSLVSRKKSPFFVALAIVLFVHLWGGLNLKNANPSGEAFPVGVIQGNVSSDIYWDRVSQEEIEALFMEHLELSRLARSRGARLIIWPEFSVPLCFSCPQPLYREFKIKLYQFVQETQSTLLLGSNETSRRGGENLYYNTALCLSPDLTVTHYYKMHLVPFGEYTPYKKIFSFIEKVTHAIGDVTPGREHTLHRFEGKPFGSPICYEIIFPALVRKFTVRGARFLVTITNDGWYGRSSAPHQHFQIAIFRAVENRRYLLRAATTGISGIVDPYGRVVARSSLMTRAVLTAMVSSRRDLSVYARYGDILPYGSLTLTAIFLMLAVVKRAHERKKTRFRRTIV